MFKHLWVECGMLSGITKKNLNFSNSYTEFHTGSWHSAGQFAGEAGEGERGR